MKIKNGFYVHKETGEVADARIFWGNWKWEILIQRINGPVLTIYYSGAQLPIEWEYLEEEE